MNKPPKPCTTPGCLNSSQSGRCEACQKRRAKLVDIVRGTSDQRGYDAHWRAVRKAFLQCYRQCVICGLPSNVADHFPRSRRSLVGDGVKDPDDWDFLRALCRDCHSRETALHQPGGWNR